MLLNEIESLTSIEKNRGMFDEIMNHWYCAEKEYIIAEGKFGKFDVRSVKSKSEWCFVLFDATQNRYAAAVDFDMFGKSAKTFQVHRVGVAPAYHGMNLAAKFYAWIISHKNIILLTGMSQSPGGRAVWESLAKMPGIFIFGYDINTKESFQIDQKDLFNEEVYTNDLQQELDELKDEYDSLDVAEKTPEERQRITQISIQVKNLQKEVYRVADYVRLVAIKKH